MTTTRSPLRTIAFGAGAGVVASLVMAMFAMIAAWAKGTGFFTPLYHIASIAGSGDAMMTSMQAATTGSNFRFVLGTAVLGALIHMMTGAMYGALFGLIVSRLNVSFPVLAVAGIAYGALVFALSAFLALPLAAAIFGAGDPIKNMAAMAGWGTFLVEHLLYGLTLGVLLGFLGRTRAPVEAPTTVHAH